MFKIEVLHSKSLKNLYTIDKLNASNSIIDVKKAIESRSKIRKIITHIESIIFYYMINYSRFQVLYRPTNAT